MFEVVQKVAIEKRLSLFLQTENRVQLRGGPGRHHGAQELHIRGWNLRIHQKVSPVGTEQHSKPLWFNQDSVKIQSPVFVVENRHRKRVFLTTVDKLANDVCAFIAEE